MSTIRLPRPRRCPSCGRLNDLHDSADPDVVPKEGDLSICWGCGQPAVFTTMGLRRLTEDEMLGPIGAYYREVVADLLATPGLTPHEAARRLPPKS